MTKTMFLGMTKVNGSERWTLSVVFDNQAAAEAWADETMAPGGWFTGCVVLSVTDDVVRDMTAPPQE